MPNVARHRAQRFTPFAALPHRDDSRHDIERALVEMGVRGLDHFHRPAGALDCMAQRAFRKKR
jgi:hypothetical protein